MWQCGTSMMCVQDGSLSSSATHALTDETWWSDFGLFLGDGSNMLVRSTLLQATFIAVTICVSRMGPSTLAAHQVIAQVWLLTSYIVDGFAAAGTVLGSRLGAIKESHPAALRCALSNSHLAALSPTPLR